MRRSCLPGEVGSLIPGGMGNLPHALFISAGKCRLLSEEMKVLHNSGNDFTILLI